MLEIIILVEDESKFGFINGDIIKIKHIKKYEELYGFNFAMCQLVSGLSWRLEIDVIVIDTLESDEGIRLWKI